MIGISRKDYLLSSRESLPMANFPMCGQFYRIMQQSSFVERLRRVIEEDPELTPAGLAVKAGLDNSAIRSLLAGRAKNPRWDTIEKICAALGTTVEEFMGNPQTKEERDIARLVSQLPVELRRQLIGYGQGLLDAQGSERPEPPGDGE